MRFRPSEKIFTGLRVLCCSMKLEGTETYDHETIGPSKKRLKKNQNGLQNYRYFGPSRAPLSKIFRSLRA